jgi:SSS family solute:Na+ symporter
LAAPSFRQRIYSGKDVTSIRKSFIYSGLLYLGFSLVPAIIGMCAYVLAGDLDNAAYAFPHIALNVMPIGLGVFIIIAGISATLSSASSDAIAGVSVLLSDIYAFFIGHKPEASKMIILSRVALIFTIGIALLLALLSNDIISYITSRISVLMSGLCVCGLLGRLWSNYTWQGAIATLLAGMATALTVTWHQPWNQYLGNPILPAIGCALIIGILVSLCTQKSQGKIIENSTSEHEPLQKTSIEALTD